MKGMGSGPFYDKMSIGWGLWDMAVGGMSLDSDLQLTLELISRRHARGRETLIMSYEMMIVIANMLECPERIYIHICTTLLLLPTGRSCLSFRYLF